jgi:hypothetical protein
MIDRCFNPDCSRKLHYLRDGRIVRVIRGKGDSVSLEHYWLCGLCYMTHDFLFPEDGSVTLRDRLGHKHEDDFCLRDVVLPERRTVQR